MTAGLTLATISRPALVLATGGESADRTPVGSRVDDRQFVVLFEAVFLFFLAMPLSTSWGSRGSG